jgi:hypothetical protein
LFLWVSIPQFKDSVFSFLFSDPVALGDVLFMERINNVSFTVGDKLVILPKHR